MTQHSILLVDDEPDLLAINKEFFEEAGFLVTTSPDGFAALQHVSDKKFSVIVTDYQMPNMNGIQLASYIKVSEHNANTPLFVISGNINEQAIETLRKVGVIGFIKKPYDLTKLVNIVKSKIPKENDGALYSTELLDLLHGSVLEVFNHYCPDQVKILDSNSLNSKDSFATYSSVIPIFGQFVYGYVSVYCNQKTLELVCESLFGEGCGPFDEQFMCDLTGEITNTIVGSIKHRMDHKDEVIQIGLPLAVKSHARALSIMPGAPKHLLTVEINKTTAYIEFSFGDPKRIQSRGTKKLTIFS